MKRRDFLGVVAATTAGRLWATPATDARFLLVFLRGGYDAASLLVPASSAFYYEARPNIALAKGACIELDGPLPVGAETYVGFFLKDEAQPLVAVARVVWSRAEGPGHLHQVRPLH